jgi:serine/threonine protein kinase
MTGTILANRYTIYEELGTGGMATVYRAHCAYLQRDVAIKVLRAEYRSNTELVHRFETEARAAASLTHPNIDQIYDVGKENGVDYIVMELVDGRSLKELLEEHGPMPWEMAVDVMIKVASALQRAHAKKIVHRDIKPQNIMLTSDGEPKVADFGIARIASATMETVKVDTVASVHYASPEQVRGGYVDAQSDLYSAGVTLYEMLTGTLPFAGRESRFRSPSAHSGRHSAGGRDKSCIAWRIGGHCGVPDAKKTVGPVSGRGKSHRRSGTGAAQPGGGRGCPPGGNRGRADRLVGHAAGAGDGGGRCAGRAGHPGSPASRARATAKRSRGGIGHACCTIPESVEPQRATLQSRKAADAVAVCGACGPDCGSSVRGLPFCDPGSRGFPKRQPLRERHGVRPRRAAGV